MFKSNLIKSIAAATNLPESEVTLLLKVPPDPKLGDYAFPCFKLGKNPVQAAQELKSKLKLPTSFPKAEAAGPYLNFYINPAELAKQTLILIKKQKKKYGAQAQKQNIVIEFCGPNTNKPLHLGHVRNMSLGSAVVHLLKFMGNNVHPVNIINDRGIHICQSMLAYQKEGKNAKPTKKGDHFVGDYYVMHSNSAKENPELEKEAHDLLLKWEANDKKTRALWKKMNSWVLKGFAQTYKRFGISFEKEYFESQYYEKGKDIAQDGLQKGIFVKDQKDAIIAPLQRFGISDKVILRADGTSLYITQDLYLAQLRYHNFKFDKMTYVVASEQNLHFQQLFKILDLLGNTWAKDLHHLSYGLVNLPTGRMKSREGTVVDADDIVDEISKLAESEIRKRHENISEFKIKKRAEFIGLGAIKFFMLRTDAIRDIVFNPEESISFEGETGPYLQYTHARACSILRKAGKVDKEIKFELLKDPQEQKVINHLLKFPEVVEQAATQYKIHIICHYLIELAQSFNEFYHAHPVISEDKYLMAARLELVDSVRQVLANGLGLLGIHAPQEM